MLNLETGWINQFLKFLGFQNPPNWLNDTAVIYPALVTIGVWGIGAGIIVNLAGLRASRPSSTTRRASTAPAGGRPCAT